MFTCTKYIVIGYKDSSGLFNVGLEKMIVFPFNIKHSEMAKAMRLFRYDAIVSAGFIDEFLQCFGESSSLMIGSRKEVDTNLLRNMLDIEEKELTFKERPEGRSRR